MTKKTFSFVEELLLSSHWGIFNTEMSHKIGINATLVFMMLTRHYCLGEHVAFRFDPGHIANLLPLSVQEVCLAMQVLQKFKMLRRFKYDDDELYWYKFEKKAIASVTQRDASMRDKKFERLEKELVGQYGAKTIRQRFDLYDKVLEVSRNEPTTQNCFTKCPPDIHADDG